MNDLKIIPMDVSHLLQVLAIERKVFTSPWSEEVFLREMREIEVSRSYVGMIDDIVAGYEIAWFIEDEIHLVNIAVPPNLQQRGIGSRMLSYLVEVGEESGMKLLTLEVRLSNMVAQAFYRSFGFDIIGVRKRYYSDNQEDAVLMALDLEMYTKLKGGKSGKEDSFEL